MLEIIAAFLLVFLASYFLSATIDSFDERRKIKAIASGVLLALSLVALDAIIEGITDKMKAEGGLVSAIQSKSFFTEKGPVSPPLVAPEARPQINSEK